MTGGHLVRPGEAAVLAAPQGWAADASGYRRWDPVGEEAGAVHTGFGVCELDPGGRVPAHVHSFEESFFVVEGSGVVETPEGAFRVGEGDYGLLPVGVPHRWRNDADRAVRWAEMQAPVPRSRYDDDTTLVDLPAARDPVADRRTRPAHAAVRHHHPRPHGRRAGRARSCSRSRPACAPRCSSTAGSP